MAISLSYITPATCVCRGPGNGGGGITGVREDDGGPAGESPGGAGIMSAFGAVPVSGRNMYSLLANGEAVLLYPGEPQHRLPCA